MKTMGFGVREICVKIMNYPLAGCLTSELFNLFNFKVKGTVCKMKMLLIAMSKCWQEGDTVKSPMKGILHGVWEVRRTQIWQ